MNYFLLFNVPESFKIDKELLTKNFYKLQLQFHPDLFMNDSETKKKMALKKSIQINKGYKILKNFLNRAIYLLSLNGLEIKKETFFLKDNIFLIKHFSLYEELDELKKNDSTSVKLNIFLKKIEKEIKKYENEIEFSFKKKNYDKVTEIIAELLFLKKIKINLKKE